MCFSPDGTKFLWVFSEWVYDYRLHEWGERQSVMERDGLTGNELRRFEFPSELVTRAAFGPDGRKIILVSHTPEDIQNSLPVESRDDSVLIPLRYDEEVQEISADGRSILVRGESLVIDTATGERTELRELLTADLHVIGFAHDGRRLACRAPESTVAIVDLETGTVWRGLRGHRATVIAAAVSVDGRRVVSLDSDGLIVVWDAESGLPLLDLEQPRYDPYAGQVTFSGDGERIISVAGSGAVYVWRLDALSKDPVDAALDAGQSNPGK